MSKPMTVERMNGIFKKYRRLHDSMTNLEKRRGSSWGIGVKEDEYALQWQKLKWRHHVLEATLEGCPVNWYNADWIDNDERQRRNELNRSNQNDS